MDAGKHLVARHNNASGFVGKPVDGAFGIFDGNLYVVAIEDWLVLG